MAVNRDSPRWCAKCKGYGDHHTAKHIDVIKDERCPYQSELLAYIASEYVGEWRTEFSNDGIWHSCGACQPPVKTVTTTGANPFPLYNPKDG